MDTYVPYMLTGHSDAGGDAAKGEATRGGGGMLHQGLLDGSDQLGGMPIVLINRAVTEKDALLRRRSSPANHAAAAARKSSIQRSPVGGATAMSKALLAASPDVINFRHSSLEVKLSVGWSSIF